MGLYEREWFWEGYESRYGSKSKKKPDSLHKTEPLKKEGHVQRKESTEFRPTKENEKPVLHACKYCSKLFNVNIPNSRVYKLLGYSFVYPFCEKTNTIGAWKAGVFLLISMAVAIVVLFLYIYFMG